MRPLEGKVEPTYEDGRQAVFVEFDDSYETRPGLTHLFCIYPRMPRRVGYGARWKVVPLMLGNRSLSKPGASDRYQQAI